MTHVMLVTIPKNHINPITSHLGLPTHI